MNISKTSKRCKRFFTLLELLICLAIIASIGVLFAIRGKELLEKQKIQMSMELLRGSFERAKFLSLVYRSDIDLQIVRYKNTYYVDMKSDEPGLSAIKRIELAGIKSIFTGKQKRKQITLAKFSSGDMLSCVLCAFHTNLGIWTVDTKGTVYEIF